MDIGFQTDNPNLLTEINKICEFAKKAGGTAYLIGGCVRDALRNKKVKDFDIEVYGISAEKLIELYSSHYRLNLVGKSFGVLKFKDYPIDVSLPRKEIKTGIGHKDFRISSDENMDFAEACMRRDFTINAMLYNPLDKKLVDPLGGLFDLKEGILRHCSEKFSEDPLRVLRLMRFAATLEFRVAEETVKISSNIDISPLTIDRVFSEWSRMLVEGVKPSLGLNFLKESNLIKFYPELDSMIGCPQDSRFHPEGDVWNHTLLCLDMYKNFMPEKKDDAIVLGFAVLCHDLGKPVTTETQKNGRITSYRHDIEGVDIAKSFLLRVTNSTQFIDKILPLVRWHMTPYQLMKSDCKDSAIRRLAAKTGRLDLLIGLLNSDRNGRGQTVPEKVEDAEFLLKRSIELDLKNKKPKQLVRGKDLIKRGLSPGKYFGDILDKCFDAQLEGVFQNYSEGLEYLDTILASEDLNVIRNNTVN